MYKWNYKPTHTKHAELMPHITSYTIKAAQKSKCDANKV